MSIALAVVEKVASIKKVDPLDLPPLYHTIDTDHLDGLVTSLSNPDDSITFRYADNTVTVTGDGDVSVEPIHESEEDRRQESYSRSIEG